MDFDEIEELFFLTFVMCGCGICNSVARTHMIAAQAESAAVAPRAGAVAESDIGQRAVAHAFATANACFGGVEETR